MTQAKGKPNMKLGCLLMLLMVIVSTMALTQCAAPASEKENADTSKSDLNIEVVFDALAYYDISEADLIAKLGEPDSIDEWTYESSYRDYPIRSLNYGNVEYLMNNNLIQRIDIWDCTYEFTDEDDILPMFGLKKTSESRVVNTGVAYRVYDCPIHDFWAVPIDGSIITGIKITYSDMFE